MAAISGNKKFDGASAEGTPGFKPPRVQMLMTDSHVYLSMAMERYIRVLSMDVVLQRAGKLIPRRRTPISPKLQVEITDLRPLNHDKARFFSRALGMCSWLSST